MQQDSLKTYSDMVLYFQEKQRAPVIDVSSSFEGRFRFGYIFRKFNPEEASGPDSSGGSGSESSE